TGCNGIVRRDTVDEIAAAVLALGEGTRLHALFPVQSLATTPAQPAEAAASDTKKPARRTKKAARPVASDTHGGLSDALRERLADLRKRGFNRLYQNGTIYEFSTPESLLEIDFRLPVFVLVDRIAVSAENRARIVDAAEIGYRESGEILFEIVPRDLQTLDPQVSAAKPRPPVRPALRFSAAFECKTCHRVYREPEPSLFSFNNPYGACPRCQGFGNTIDFDLDLVIPDKTKTLSEGVIEPWTKPKYRPLATEMKRYARAAGIPLDVPWEALTPNQRDFILDGEGRFMGVRGFFAHLERKKYKLHVRVFLSRYRGYSLCGSCNGTRLRADARQVKIAGKDICQVTAMTVEDAAGFFRDLKLTRQENDIAGKLLEEIRERLRFLNDVGLEYLTLDRLSSTLSGGEAQRIQLATSLGSHLVGTLYVLDEPSIGLHSRDTERLINILHNLRDLGNTILVVEHDPEIMRASDRILDLGPGAGEHGGKLVAQGTYETLRDEHTSLTGRYLHGDLHIAMPSQRRSATKRKLALRGVRGHNLKNFDITFPLDMIVAVTGVSGSGKSTLVHDVLYQALAAAKKQTTGVTPEGQWSKLEGDEFIDEVVLVDQSPIGRTPRSNPVTYIKAFDAIRELFASLPESQKQGYAAGHFSFNIPGGRCEACQGDGTVTVEMQFLADVELICEECKGTRYKPEILRVHYHGRNIHDVLNLTVREAMHFFNGSQKILDKLKVLDEVGLGYLRLGQSATTLSGGEAQRMKLAAHLQPRSAIRVNAEGEESKRRRRVLYIFDEPTTGLHFDDVSKLLAAFRRLIDAGGSIVVIEHNLDVIKVADWVIDLGPEGGARGGRVVGVGTPEQIAGLSKSYTGKWLTRILPANENAHSNAS
ncbi:MAG: excinuclease ABC subunit UvrA, partial [Terriglobia bacterium]|nr:excinuclease ABC subunit UvrA [Terriglobia bacterium]